MVEVDRRVPLVRLPSLCLPPLLGPFPPRRSSVGRDLGRSEIGTGTPPGLTAYPLAPVGGTTRQELVRTRSDSYLDNPGRLVVEVRQVWEVD